MAFTKMQQPPPPARAAPAPSRIISGGRCSGAIKGSRSVSPVPSDGSARGAQSRRQFVSPTRKALGMHKVGSSTYCGGAALRSPTPTPDQAHRRASARGQVLASTAYVATGLGHQRKVPPPGPAPPSQGQGLRKLSPQAPRRERSPQLHHQHLHRAGATPSSWRQPRQMSANAASREGSPLLSSAAFKGVGPPKQLSSGAASWDSSLAVEKMARPGKIAPSGPHASPMASFKDRSQVKGPLSQDAPSAMRHAQAAAKQGGSRQLQLHRMDGARSVSPGRFDFAANNQVRPAHDAARALTNLGINGWSRPGPTRQLSRGRTPSPDLRLSKPKPVGTEGDRALPRPLHVPKKISTAVELELRDGWRIANFKQGLFKAEVRKATDDIEIARKEVKKLQTLTNRKDWDVWREEQKQVMLNWKSDLDSHRLYRQEEEMGFQELALAQAKALLQEKLRLSKEHLDFKQEMHEVTEEEERRHIAHERQHYAEQQSQQQALEAEYQTRRSGAQAYRREILQQDVEGRARSRLRDRTDELESKAHEKRLELAQTMKSLEAERQRLLEKSAYADRMRSASPMSDLAQRLTSGQAQRIAPPRRCSKT